MFEKERAESRLKQGLTEAPEEISVKFGGIVQQQDLKP